MSTSVDNRVLQMKFDNASFEKNAQTSMETLGKLNKSLTLTEGVKGLSNISHAANKVDMSGLGRSVDAVHLKFSALEVMAVTALANITNAALATGIRVTKALMFDPIKTGFQEYETQINAVQTILANTESKGSTLNNVNAALAELNTYADKTIYNFTEMTRNIGTFTAAGVSLDTSVSAIKGIANLAAVSGSNAQQASTAMYQLSQALASGTVKLMDWNSVVNAGMGGQVFQDALKETAKVHGVNIDAMIKKEGSFRETLQEGWLTSEILTETLSKFTGDLNAEQLKSMGYSDDQIKSILKLGQTANDAATKVKTFTQLFDTLKEAAQSGWTQSWSIIVGDFGEAKELLTEMSNTFGGIIGEMSNSRNDLLMGGLASGWKQILDKGIADSAGYEEAIAEVALKHGIDLNKMVDSETTFQDALKKSMKSKTLGASTLSEALQILTDKTKGLSDAQLKEIGYTREQVNNLEAFNEGVKNGSISMDDLANKMMRKSGRENLIEALRNSLNGILSIIKPIAEAFREVFPATTAEQLYNFTVTLKELSKNLTISKDSSDKLKMTFKGLFSAMDLVRKVLVGVFNSVFPLTSIFGKLNFNLLDVTASMGAWMTEFNDSIPGFEFFKFDIPKITQNINDLIEIFKTKFVIPGIEKANELFKDASMYIDIFSKGVTDAFRQIKADATDGLEYANGKFENFLIILDNTKESLQLFGNKINNTFESVKKKVKDTFGPMGSQIADAFSDVTIPDVIGTGMITGIIVVIRKLLKNVDSMVSNFDDVLNGVVKVLDTTRESLEVWQTSIKADILWKIAGAVALLALSLIALSMVKADKLKQGLAGVTILLGEIIGTMQIMSKMSLTNMGPAALSLMLMAGAIAILAMSMNSLKEFQTWDQTWPAIAALSALMFGLVQAIKAISKSIKGIDALELFKTTIAIFVFAAALKQLSTAVKMFSSLTPEQLQQGLMAIGGILLEIGYFLKIADFNKFTNGKDTIIGLAVGLLLLYGSVKLFGTIPIAELEQGLITVGLLMASLAAAMYVMNGVDIKGGAVTLMAMAIALNLLIIPIKMLGAMPYEQLYQGMIALGLIMAGIMVAMYALNGGAFIEMGAGLLLLAIGLNALIVPIAALGVIPYEQLCQGLGALGVILAALVVTMYLLTPIALPMLAVAAALLLFGVAAATTGIGIAQLAVGLTMLAAIGYVGAKSIVDAISVIVPGIAKMIPQIVTMLAEGWLAFLQVMADNGPAFVLAITSIVGSILSIIKNVVPAIIETLAILLEKLLQTLAEHMPEFVASAWAISLAIMQGLASHIEEMVTLGAEIAIGFMNGMVAKMPEMYVAATNLIVAFINGIASMYEPIMQASFNAMITFIYALSDTIDKNTPIMNQAIDRLFNSILNAAITILMGGVGRMREQGNRLMDAIKSGISDKIEDIKSKIKESLDAAVETIRSVYESFKSAGSHIIQGLIDGVESNIKKAQEMASNLGKKILAAAEKALRIESPSKEFAEVGKYTVLGLVKGIQQYATNAYGAATDMATGTLNAMKDSMSGVSNVITDNMDLNPVIRPTLDLSNITTGAKTISSMFNNQKLGVNGEINQNDGTTETAVGTVQVTQNIYSPKALSRTEIYRQTKNLFATTKGIVNNV